MAEVSLVTRAEVNAYLSISVNKDETRFNTFINRVQKNNLRKLLGDAMYYDLFQNVTDINTIAAPYGDLVNGKSYTYQGNTIQYYGLKPYISFLYGINILYEGDNFHADYGNAMFVDNPQDHLGASSFRAKQEIRRGYEEEANYYKCEIMKFLQENLTTYTLWAQEWQPPDRRSRIIRSTIN
jgi:hypothetical protein